MIIVHRELVRKIQSLIVSLPIYFVLPSHNKSQYFMNNFPSYTKIRQSTSLAQIALVKL